MTIEVADGIWQLTPTPFVNTWVIRDEAGVTLVDTGLAGGVGRLRRQLRAVGVREDEVRSILLTHSHPDHAGGVAPLLRAGVDAGVQVGEADVDAVRTGTQPRSDDDTRSGRVYNRLPSWLTFGEPDPVPTAVAVPPATELPIGGGLVAVPTPGHTPGHTAFHLPAHRLVLAGDVLFNVFRLRPAPALTCWNVPLNHDSVAVLADLDVDTVLLAHGGPVDDDPRGRLRQLLADDR